MCCQAPVRLQAQPPPLLPSVPSPESGLSRPPRGVTPGRTGRSAWGTLPGLQPGPTGARERGDANGAEPGAGCAPARGPAQRWATRVKTAVSAATEQVSWRARRAWGLRPGLSHLQRGGHGREPRAAGRALPCERPSPRPPAAPSVPGCSPCARRGPGLRGRRGGGRAESAGTATRGAGPELGRWKKLGELPPGLGPSAGPCPPRRPSWRRRWAR